MELSKPSIGVPETTIRKQVVWLAAPVVVEQALLYLVGLSDTILTGRYFAPDHLAGVTVASYLLWFLASILTIVSVGATALVARLRGANDPAGAARVAQQAIGMSLLVGLLIMLMGWALTDQVVASMNLRGTPAQAASSFLKIVITVVPLLACSTAGIACLRGVGDTRTGMWVMIAVNLVNVVVSWSLVVGIGPMPAIGFPGIAVGTATAEGVGGVIVLALLLRGRSGLRLEPTGWRPDWTDIGRILRVSLPATGESLTNILGQLWFLGVINRLGAVATAAHGVAIRCEAIAFLTITAFAVAASTLTGQYLGASRSDLAGKATRTSWWLGSLALAIQGVVIYSFAGPMFGFFLGGTRTEVASVGVPVLRLVTFALPALATISVLSGALRGAGDTRWPWLIVLLGYALVRMPLTYLLTGTLRIEGFDWGLYGAWVAMFLDLYIRAGLIAARFLHGGWKTVRV